MGQSLSDIKRVLYRLKRQYGVEVKLVQIELGEVNFRQGNRATNTPTITTIRKGILLPKMLNSTFYQDIAYLAANKNFTSGGFVDSNIRTLIIDNRNLPNNYERNKQDYFLVKTQKYSISKSDTTVEDLGTIFFIKQLIQDTND